jgi:RecA-family ATPase
MISTAFRAISGSTTAGVPLQIFRMAIAADGVALIAHPSVAGINNDTGLSGTTQWHSSVRSRMWLRKTEVDEQPDSDLREIVLKKNNYGPVSKSIVLRWQNGLFLPLAAVTSRQGRTRKQRGKSVADTARPLAEQGRNVSHIKTSPKPNEFAVEPEANSRDQKRRSPPR